MKKNFFKILYIAICIVFMKFIVHYCRNNIDVVEFYYSRKIYPKISSILNLLFDPLPFSAGEVLLTLLLIYLFIKLVFLIKDFSVKKLINYTLNTLMLIVSLQLLFWYLWGINNYRYTFDELSDITVSPSTVEELKEVCIYLVEKTNELRSIMPENEHNITYVNNYTSIFDYSENAYENISYKYDIVPHDSFCKPKAMFFSKIMCELNFTGIFNPFTSEANINIKEPSFKLPFTICHELAHQKGFPRENEANFISFITCINSENEIYEYSGYISALIYCMNALYSTDKDIYYMVKEEYSEGLTRDLEYLKFFWSEYKGKTAEIASKNNDLFLKSTNQPLGVKSYGVVVDLIIAYLRNTIYN